MWTKEQKNYLYENWGRYGTHELSIRLKKGIRSVRYMGHKLGLKDVIDYTDYISMIDVQKLLGLNSIQTVKTFRDKFGLKLKVIPKIHGKMNLISTDNLMKWLKKHQDLWDSKKVELYSLGEEPEWLKMKRELDKTKVYKTFKLWTQAEISLAKMMFSYGKSYGDIAKKLNKKRESVREKLNKLYKQQRGKNDVRKNMSSM